MNWFRHHHPRFTVLPVTDAWQLQRVAAVFRRKGLVVEPIRAEAELSSTDRNHLVLG